MNRKRALIATAIVGGFMAWGACGDDPTGPTVASVEVTPAAATIALGETEQLTCTAKDAQGNTLTGRTVTWWSNDDAIATVGANGLVTGVAGGDAVIIAVSEGVPGTANITVLKPVAEVEVTPAAAYVYAGTTLQLMATPRDAQGDPLTGRTVTWSSSDNAIATVDDYGLVTGVDYGDATITATSEGVDGSAEITVAVGITGTWNGTWAPGSTVWDLTLNITEDGDGNVTGTGLLRSDGNPWTDPTTVAGTRSGVDVLLTVTVGAFNPFDFIGTWDGANTMTGVINGSGFVNEPTTMTRTSYTPAPPSAAQQEAARAVREGNVASKGPLYRRPGNN
jgi:hypothetical protein